MLLILSISRETYDNIYLDLSKNSGRCRFADSGIGWKPAAGGDTWTLDRSEIVQASWSKGSKGYELRIIRKEEPNVVQLDGFQQEVGLHLQWQLRSLTN
jgi:structure-specific recognition protein 1